MCPVSPEKVAKGWPVSGRTMAGPQRRAPGRPGRNGEDTMPGLVAPLADERELLLAFLGQQRDALRYAAHGLDRRAGRRPARRSASSASAGLIKHAALVERAWTTFIDTGDTGVFAPDGRLGRRVPPRPTGRPSTTCSPWPTSRPGTTEKVVGALEDLGAPLRADHRPRPVDPRRHRLDAALGAAAPHRGDGPPRRARRHHPRVHRRRHLLDADGRGRGLAGAGLGVGGARHHP